MSRPTDEAIEQAARIEIDSSREEVLDAIAVAESLSRWAREEVAYIRSLAASWIGQNGPIDLMDGRRYISAVKRKEWVRDQGKALDDALTQVGGDFDVFASLLKSQTLLKGRCRDVLGEDFLAEHWASETKTDEHGAPARELRLIPAKKKGAA